MCRKPDYTEYLNENFEVTNTDWNEHPELHDRQFEAVDFMLRTYPITDLIEIGCGAGHLASRIPAAIGYTGFDKSGAALVTAVNRNPTRHFIQGDIRNAGLPKCDLVICFSFLKHFSCCEWPAVLNKVLSRGRFGVFDMPVGPVNMDDGIYYPHLWLTQDFIKATLAALKFSIVSISNAADPNDKEWQFYVCNEA